MFSLDLDRDGADIFLDARDDTTRSSTASSTARCSTSDQAPAPWRPDYDLWTGEPASVDERRHRFMMGMGLAQPVPTGPACRCEASSDCCAFHDLEERVSSICSSYRSSLSLSQCASSAPDVSYCVRDLDIRSRVVAHGSELDARSGGSEEFGADQIMSINQSRAFLSFSQLVREFLCSGCGRSHTRNKREEAICMPDAPVKTTGTLCRTKVDQQSKKWVDFSAVYMCQEIQAHGGAIRAIKFSPSGWYLASVGEDNIVRVWTVGEVESSPDLYGREAPVHCRDRHKGLTMKLGKGRSRTLAIIPKEVFNISETPVHEFHGHTSDVLDMAWSKSNFLLTSCKDKTVRMWKVGCDDCLAVFRHRDYVTCVQFNPVDERYFVSGSIDGKVRVWDVQDKRVVDWADAKDIITAVSYQPDGKGLIVGLVSGRCRFYDHAGENMELEKVMKVKKRKSSGSQITNLQVIDSASHFSRGDPSRIMIASAGCKIRVSEGAAITWKFEGRRGSKALVPPALTSDGRYLVSAGADSNVYIWNFDKFGGRKSTRGASTVRSCEHFFSEGVTSVATWPGLLHREAGSGGNGSDGGDLLQRPEKGPTLCRDRECCSFGAWFFADGMKGAATWPEEKLLPSLKYVNCAGRDECRAKVSAAWNTVIVTGARNGVIRCFHNYGLPVKL